MKELCKKCLSKQLIDKGIPLDLTALKGTQLAQAIRLAIFLRRKLNLCYYRELPEDEKP